ncbi:protocadherin alpha-C2-like [Corticium candelabrum]|uniref:protocadherin alpha-C2-like n=1 Tax=Corticium candelabrum TaxID=121492 RepID=UPI002E25B299|nr:protocadherin alpha-C2-like [Corticium candelabrum]
MHGGVVPENGSPQVVATFTTQDPDNEFYNRQSFVYALTNEPQDFPFVITDNDLKTTVSLDYEQKQSWQVFVRSTDSGGLSIDEVFQVDVTDVNERPSSISLVGATSVPENSPATTYIGQIVTTDVDFNQTYTYSLQAAIASSNGQQGKTQWIDAFVLDSKTGRLSVGTDGLDYEAARQLTLRIVTTDSGDPAYSYNGSVVVTIVDVNESPSDISLNGSEISENSAVNTVVGTLTVTDPDNEFITRQSFHCLMLNKATKPFMVTNNLTLVATDFVDFEQQQFYIVEVRCIDNGIPSLYIEKQLNIRVRDVNEPPANVSLSSQTIKENQEAGSLVGIASSQDPDNVGRWAQNVTYAIVDRDVPFELNGTDVVSTRKLNFESKSIYVFRLAAIDSGVPRKTTTVEIAVGIVDINDRPLLVEWHSKGVFENSTSGTHVGWLHTIDEDRDQSHNYSVIAQSDNQGLFAIDGNALVVASGALLDFEEQSEHVLVIESTDNGTSPLSVQNSIIVHVVNVNERPTNIVSYKTIEINENSPPGTWITNLSVIDEDINQPHTCTLLNATQYVTLIGSDRSTLVVSQSAQIDFETFANIWVNVECRDSGVPALGVRRAFHIAVIDVNEAPTKIILNGSRYLREDLSVGDSIAELSVVDDDAGQSHTYAVVGRMAATFTVDNARRQLIRANLRRNRCQRRRFSTIVFSSDVHVYCR